MPQFNDFVLIPSVRNDNYIMLNWLENDSDYLFGPHQISDGSLRFMALATLLLQPPASLPSVVILDEPELGLHPTAISLFAGMVKTASQYSQIILATQSTRLIDEFDSNDLVVVERDKKENSSTFKKPDSNSLSEWMEKYSTSELWEKNIFGGRP
jgi:predicted ATPase